MDGTGGAIPQLCSDDGAIVHRDLAFDFPVQPDLTWCGGRRADTAFFNALSMLFPSGEQFFVDTVRACLDLIDSPELRRTAVLFIAQEAAHSREHGAYNRHLAEPGGAAEAIAVSRARYIKALQKRLPLQRRLAMTCALEHLTVLVSEQLLNDPNYLTDAREPFASLWRWHSVEELEHKALAVDLYRRLYGGFGGYWVRVLVMAKAGVTFLAIVLGHAQMLAGQVTPSQGLELRRQITRFAYGRPGLVRRALPRYLQYFIPGFHPNWANDAKAIARGRAALSPA